jgi:hypothetical protein
VNEPTHLRHVLRAAQETARHIVVDGVPWLVYELPALPFDRRNSTSLVFESDNSVRRVRDFPADWRSLTDDELAELSWNA